MNVISCRAGNQHGAIAFVNGSVNDEGEWRALIEEALGKEAWQQILSATNAMQESTWLIFEKIFERWQSADST